MTEVVRTEKIMSEERYKIVFLGLTDDSPDTTEKFRQNLSKVFKVTGAQIDRLIAKSPVIIKKNLNREKADSIAKKLEMIGGNVRIELDKPVTAQRQETLQSEEKPGTFNVYINKIESEDAKHGIANYLNGILDISYLEIRNELLKEIPVLLPAEFDHEKAKAVRENLEGLGSRVSISKTTKDDLPSHRIRARNGKRVVGILIGILIVVFLAFIVLINAFKYEDTGLETAESAIEEQMREPRGDGIENRPYLPLAKEAVEALEELEARFQDDISFTEFDELLGEAQTQIQAYLESQEAKSRVRIANSILNVMIHYQNAAEIWKYQIKYNRSHIRKTRDDVQLYLRRYPDVNKPISEGGAIDDIGGGEDMLQIAAMVSIVMDQASMELRRVSGLL